MGTGYTRNDSANNIADGNIINASDLDGEFDAVESAFNSSSGHTHDGTSAEGAPIEVIGPTQDVVITASVLRPKTTNTVDLGTSSLEFKDAFFDGTITTDALAVTAGITSNVVTVSSDNAGSAKGPQLDILRDSSSPADSDAIGYIDFSGKDDGDNKTTYASILASIGDVTDGTEDGTLKFNTMVAGTDTTVITIIESKVGILDSNPDGALHVYNGMLQVGSKTGDTSIQQNTNAIRIAAVPNSSTEWGGLQWYREFSDVIGAEIIASRASANESDTDLIFKTSTNSSNAIEVMRIDHNGQVTITTTGNETQLTLKSTDADATTGPNMTFFRDSSSAADSDQTGSIFFIGKDDATNDTTYAAITTHIVDASNTTEDGRLTISSMKAGTSTESLTVASGNIGIGTTSPTVLLDVDNSSSGNTAILRNNTTSSYATTDGGLDNMLTLVSTGTSASQSAGIQFSLSKSGQTGAISEIGAIRTANGESGVVFRTRNSATGVNEHMRIDSNGELIVGKTSTAFGDVGHRISGDGFIYGTRTMGGGGTDPVFLANILSNDGNAIEVYKDGTKAGFIATEGGYTKVVGGNGSVGSGLLFTNQVLSPRDAAGASSNGVLTLGESGAKFRDAHFSGVVDVGEITYDNFNDGSGNGGLNVVRVSSYDNDSANTLGSDFNNRHTILYVVTNNGVTAIPMYPNAGAGVAWQVRIFDPDDLVFRNNQVDWVQGGSSGNSFQVVVSSGGGSATIQRTGGSLAYTAYVSRQSGGTA